MVEQQTDKVDLENNPVFQEWKESQAWIERFDRMIFELRKYGFSLITLLLGANGFLLSNEGVRPFSILGIYLALLVLITGLFRIDRTHQVFLRATVLRAMELESRDTLGFALTRGISRWSGELNTATWGQYLYMFFCVAAFVLTAGALVDRIEPGSAYVLEAVCLALALVFLIVGCGYIAIHHEKNSKEIQAAFDNVVPSSRPATR